MASFKGNQYSAPLPLHVFFAEIDLLGTSVIEVPAPHPHLPFPSCPLLTHSESQAPCAWLPFVEAPQQNTKGHFLMRMTC